MVKRSSLRFPVTVAVDDQEHDEHQKLGERKRIVASTLQSANINLGNWNKANLLKRLTSSREQFAGVVYIKVKVLRGSLAVCLATDEELLVKELLRELDIAQKQMLLFMEIQEPIDDIFDILGSINSRCGFIAFEQGLAKWAFAVAMETTNLRSVQTMKGNGGTFGQLFEFVISAFESATLVLSESSIQFLAGSPVDDVNECIVWHAMKSIDHGVEIGNVVKHARKEQLDDAVKELLDAASAPRTPHQPTNKRLISTQGLFWLSQVKDLIDIDGWITSTTLFAEVYPEHVLSIPTSDFVYNELPRVEKLVELLDQLLPIPAGFYRFGRSQSVILSEPPANLIEGHLRSFWITKFPITEELWCSVFEGAIKEGALNPVTNINYFEIVAFCAALNEILSKNVLKRFGKSVFSVPTEYEWEAAAAGPNGLDYPWGDSYDPDKCNAEMRIGGTTAVNQYLGLGDSPFELSDMSGNVREWTSSYAGSRGSDWQRHSLDRLAVKTEAAGAMNRLIIRGGSYSFDAECTQTWVRNTQIARRRDHQTGFRVVLRTT